MTASAMTTDIAYTKFTFALFEDTGFYKPTYTDLDDFTWYQF